MTDFLSSLNAEQREAVLATEGPLLILAGAGSGKTRVIAHRIAYLISEKQVPTWNILAVTFTNKAAEEMRQRVHKLLRDQELPSSPWVSTFHRLCVRILRQDIEKLAAGYSRTFTIYDQDDSLSLIKNCIKDLGYDEKQLSPRATQATISGAKNRSQDPDLFAADTDYQDERRAAIASVYRVYDERLRGNNSLDFDDLLIKTVRLLRKVAAVREKYNNKFRYILVDEYQDTNALQFALISLLTKKQQNICVVGDEDQSIYKWRGADINNILDFEIHFPNARVVRLEQNYRSTQIILDFAGALVKHNVERKGKHLWTANPRGERIRYYQALDAENEARFVAGKILEHRSQDYDIRAAVLYRTNSQSRVFEEAMRRAGLSYNIVGGFSFYERTEVRDIISYLKLALNPNDSIALQRVINSPPRGIGRNTVEELQRRAKDFGLSLWETILLVIEKPDGLGRRAVSALKDFRNLIQGLSKLSGTAAPAGPFPDGESEELSRVDSVSEIVKAAIIDTSYEAALRSVKTDEAQGRLENLQELVNAAVDYDDQGVDGLREFIDHSALLSDADHYKAEAPVTLITAHSAKGLEFPLVFMVGLEDGLFPHSRSATDRADLEEERRLAYVAMTRAEKYLYVTHAMKRRVYGAELASEPSLFLNEIPHELMEDLTTGNSWLSFAHPASASDHRDGEPHKERKKFSGKTYDNVDSIAEFFKLRNQQLGHSSKAWEQRKLIAGERQARSADGQSLGKLGTPNLNPATSSEFIPGSYVRHAKYGRGLVLHREGAGDSTKLTVSFPGFGQKKLVQKYAGLQKA